MGTWLQIIADVEASETEAAELAQKVKNWLVSRGIIESTPAEQPSSADDDAYSPGPNATSILEEPGGALYPDNTVSITVGRTVFHTYQSGLTLICEKCGSHNEDGDGWSDAVGEWYDNRGPGILACAPCGHALPITQWRFEPAWGFGFLGFTFWNWPTLDPAFIEEIARLLGHKIVYIYDKL